jgi:PAS domain S-box-containing protein
MKSAISARQEPSTSIDKKTLWIIGIASAGFVFTWLFPFHPVGVGLRGYAPLHTVLEIFAVGIASAIFAIGWHARLTRESGSLALLAAGYLGVALLDTAHLLSFNGMPDWLTPSSSEKAIAFWFMARFLAAFTLLAFVYFSGTQKYRRGTEWIILASAILLVIIAGGIVLGKPNWLPVFIRGEHGGLTPLKISTEWLLVFFNLGILALVWQRRETTDLYRTSDLMAAIWLTCLSELCFTLYSNAADVFNLMGHVYKVLSYLFLYRAVVVGSVKVPYQLLSESQEILQQLTDNISQVFWITTSDKSKMLYISPAYEKVWQRPIAPLKDSGKIWLDAVHPDDRERVEQYMGSQSQGMDSINYRIVRPDGSIRHIRSRSFPVRDESGEVQRIAGVAEDVTDDMHARKEHEKMEHLLQATQAAAHLGSWELDLEKDHITWSDEVYRIFGISPQDFGNDYGSFLLLVHPEDRVSTDREYCESLGQDKESYEIYHRLIRPSDNAVRYVQERFSHHRDKNGRVIRSLGTVYDVTEQKEAEKQQSILYGQLLQAQKMEAIGQLTGGIAHDFNNMLGAILGYAYLLSLFNKDNMDYGQLKNYINEILTAGNRAKELISQMLIFSRLNPGADDKMESPVLIQPILKEVLQLLRQSIPSTIDINSQLEDEKLKALFHPVHLHQILMNLAINARDASTQGYGEIDFHIEKQSVSGVCSACHEHFEGEYVVISVSDSGEGISEEILSHIFDPFFTTKEVGKGTGMGLSVVHGMVHSHKGHILVQSRPEFDGTRIQILLIPASEQVSLKAEPSTTEENEVERKMHGLKVMVVDDERAMALLLQKLLEHYGAEVTPFNDPLEALAAFKDDPARFDLVITDETMPKLSGLDLSRELLELRKDLPIVLCTGFSETVNEDIIRKTGIAKLLRKPVPNNIFIETVADLAERISH